MSEDFKVEVVAIDAILEHPNADRLEIAQVKGWNCVTGKGVFKPGDKCLYIPIDSVLPADLEAYLFPEASEIACANGKDTRCCKSGHGCRTYRRTKRLR